MAGELDRPAKRMRSVHTYKVCILDQPYDKWEKRMLGEKGLYSLHSIEVKGLGLRSSSRSAMNQLWGLGLLASVPPRHHLGGRHSDKPPALWFLMIYGYVSALV